MTERAYGYALDILTPIQHVATKLDEAAPAALSFAQLLEGFEPMGGDLHRVKLHELKDRNASDESAKVWLLGEAVRTISRWVNADIGGVRFKADCKFEDIRWQKKPINRLVDNIAKFGDPFSKMRGVFHTNIREDLGDMVELRESMLYNGWLDEFPAIADENGTVLVGHRRIAVAKELDIPIKLKVVTLGEGDAADAERFKLAIGSNLGGKPFSKRDRQRISEYLYKDREWSQERVAEALKIDQKTVSRDLVELGITPNSKRGRPRKERPHAQVIVDRVRSGQRREDVGKMYGVTRRVVDAIMDVNEAREEGRAEMQAELKTCPHCGHTWKK